jgi:periplasmic copper chaperone A
VKKFAFSTVAALAGLGLLAPAAFAHVTVNPNEAKQGGYTKVAFRVPNEKDSADTTQVEVVIPTDHPIASVSVKPHQGWTYTVDKTRLTTPITTDDGDKVEEAVSKITWKAGAANAIKPGEFDEFEVSMGPLPDVDSIVFKALQTYSDGDIVRWIEEAAPGTQEPEHPAPVLKLTKGSGDDHTAAPPAETTPSTLATVKSEGAIEPLKGVATKKDVDSANWLSFGALVVGFVGLCVGMLALVRLRRNPGVSPGG